MKFSELQIGSRFAWVNPPIINGISLYGIMVKTGERSFRRNTDEPGYDFHLSPTEYHMNAETTLCH